MILIKYELDISYLRGWNVQFYLEFSVTDLTEMSDLNAYMCTFLTDFVKLY